MSKQTTTNTETIVSVPVDAIDPDPANPTRRVDAAFVASIKEHGVRQPVIVRVNPDDPERYRLVAGHRRLTGAQRAKRTHVPAIVRELSDVDAVTEQLIENIHRADLTPCQEAAEMLRLVELGMTQKELAKRVGRSAKVVSERLRLLELPKKAQRLVDDGTFTVEGGLALTRLLDYPDQLASVIEAEPYDAVATVRMTLDEIKRDEKVQSIVAKAERDGVSVVEWDGYYPKAYKELGHGLDVDPKAHAAEPCHAIVIPPRGKEAVPVCTEPKRHNVRGASPVKAARAEQDDARRAEERAERKARRESNEHRQEFVASLLSGRLRRTAALDLVLRSYLERVPWNDMKKTGKLLGLEPVESKYGDGWRPAVTNYADTSDTNLLRACLAVVIIRAEADHGHGANVAHVQRYRAWLTGEGYQPTPYEREHQGWKRTKARSGSKRKGKKAKRKTA